MARQALVDRLVRWARRSAVVPAGRRRLLIVQIDGLSRSALERALDTRRMPHLARMLRRGLLVARPLSAGLPTSTPAFQAAAMYGVMPDIPGFHFFDKREGIELHFPRAGVADLVERRVAAGRRGILEHGACYGCVFTGGADEALFTFARLLAPARLRLAWVGVPVMVGVTAWVLVKCLALTAVELARFAAHLARNGRRRFRRALDWLGLRLGFSIWIRQFFTLAATTDLYRGTRAVYVNYLDYDVFAHAFGPEHRAALDSLRRVDSSIRQLARVAARLPDLGYDLYVLADHGQARTRTLRAVTGGDSLDTVVRAALADSGAGTGVAWPQSDWNYAEHLGAYRRGGGRLWRARGAPPPDDAEAPPPKDGIRVIAAGPNGFVYFLDSPDPVTAEEIEVRFPGALARLSGQPGIGLVLARSSAGRPRGWHRGAEIPLDPAAPAADGHPFSARPDRAVVLDGLRDLMAMRTAGDVVVYGIGADGGDVSFIEEAGAHAGPSASEMQVFVLHPPAAPVPAEPLNHPIQLYPVFASYLD